MKPHAFRLTKGMDLLKSIKEYCAEHNIRAGIVLSGVGCVYRAKIRDAGGVEINEIDEDLEIVSICGTVSKNRCHLHVSFSKRDLSVVGGHLVEGCMVNTTCEVVLLEIENYIFEKEHDKSTGYDELKIISNSRG